MTLFWGAYSLFLTVFVVILIMRVEDDRDDIEALKERVKKLEAACP